MPQISYVRFQRSIFAVIVASCLTACRVRVPAPSGHSSESIHERLVHLAGGQPKSFLWELKEGEALEVRVIQMGARVTLRLFDEHNSLLLQVNGPNGPYSVESMFWVANAPGVYRTEIVSLDPRRATVTCRALARRRKATSFDNDVVRAEIAYIKAEALLARNSTAVEMKEAQAQYASAVLSIEQAGNDALEAEILNRYSLTFAAQS